MGRIRFWIAQIVWFMTVVFAGLAGNSMDASAGAFVMASLFFSILASGFLLNWGNQRENREDRTAQMLIRGGISALLWLSYLVAILGGSSQSSGTDVLLAIVLMIPLLVMNAFIWMWERINRVVSIAPEAQESDIEKRKRDRIDAVLRDLSTDDLERLRERLQVGAVHDDHLQMMLGDDGEMLYRQR
jgi:Zn-dependent protease with chaperone function